jgi:hypothetical protein
VAEGDIIDIDKYLVSGLTVPDLAAGIARVPQDCPDGRFGPGSTAIRSVLVASRVVGPRGENPVSGKGLGNGIQTAAGEKLGEDPLHYRRCCWVDLEAA